MMFTKKELGLIQKLIQKKRADLSISMKLRLTLYAASIAKGVYSTDEKETILALLEEYQKTRWLLWSSERKLIEQLSQKLKQSIRNEQTNGLSYIRPVSFK
ncbi:hypothetical protein [Aneurinibacillus sp. REN35]|uniref:hypothetical protein n=1 Tax=Aneurinibacillus sp. REN35 TaxID=3237286 RepID=UPI0035274084